MIQIYPVTETEYHTINYFVKINGQQAAVITSGKLRTFENEAA